MFLAVIAFLTLPGPALPSVAAGILFVINGAMIIGRYRKDPGRASLKSAQAALSECDDRVRAAAAQVEGLEAERTRRGTQRDRDVSSVEKKTRGTEERAAREIDGVKPHRATDSGTARIFYDVGESLGLPVWGEALDWVKKNRKGKPFAATRLYRLDDLRDSLLALGRDPEEIRRIFGMKKVSGMKEVSGWFVTPR